MWVTENKVEGLCVCNRKQGEIFVYVTKNNVEQSV